MSGLFGTDGVRGIPGRYPLVPGTIRRLAWTAARTLQRRASGASFPRNGTAPTVWMGRDPRSSGLALERALTQGFAAAGCAVRDAGVLPTPALAYLTPRRGALCGVMVSASHNPAEFNGIKFIAHDGFKMSADLEQEIEARLADAADPGPVSARIVRDGQAEDDYLEYLCSTFPPHLDLSGMRIVADCANGAAYRIAPRLLRRLGAEVFPIGIRPNGRNINEGYGALATDAMRREIVRRKARCGFSLDGDADRAIFADARGNVCDGDLLISIAATDLQERKLLRSDKVALTVMSNYGLIRFLEDRGISVVQVPVGDRNVTDAIERGRLCLGGENSGHIVFRRFSPTGDGLLTVLQTLAVVARTGHDLGFFRRRYRVYPQILRNVRTEARVPLESLPRLQACLRECRRRLQGRGRVVIRYSGTEPLLRVLVEGPERGPIRAMSEEIVAAFKRETAAERDPAAEGLE